MKYKVGQILYLIGENSMKILPIQVVEEVTTTTVDGSSKTYTVLLPDNKDTKIDIARVKGQIFESKESVRDFMINNATTAIDEMIKVAVDLSNKKFPAKESNEHDDENIINKLVKDSKEKKSKVVHKKENNDIIKVDLGNGKFANMSTNNLQKIRG